jgi:C1A family cysteine protease
VSVVSEEELEMAEAPYDLAALRTQIAQTGAGWEAGETSVSVLPAAQRLLRLGADVTLATRRQGASAAAHQAGQSAGYPAEFDWRNQGGLNFITPVRDQANCGSCVSFGVAATIEGTFQVQRNNPNTGVDLSEAHIFYCYGAAAGANCETGWWPDTPFNNVRDSGVVDEACFPYTPGDQACKLCSDSQSRLTRITGWHAIADVGQMKTWISTRGPLSTCFTVYNDFFAYRSGVYRHVDNTVAGGHCVSVVGYSDVSGCWICKNSWGPSWGASGFFSIAYGDSGIDAHMWAVEGILETGWLNNVKVVGLWAINEDDNAWVYIAGIGWRKIAPDNINITVDILTELASAKAGARPCNIYQDAGVIKQVYVF